jgi:hypothetical protein
VPLCCDKMECMNSEYLTCAFDDHSMVCVEVR